MQAGGITINFPTVDWTQLVPQLVSLFFDGIGKYLNDALHSAFDGLWHSGANVVGQTDLSMTWGFGPIHDQVVSVQNGARAVLVFALVLVGVRSILGGIARSHSDVISDLVDHVLVAVVLLAAFPLLVPELITLTNQAATAVGTADLSKYLQSGGSQNAMVQAVLFIILLFFAIRLLFKAGWRIGLLAVLLPVGPLACALYAIPATRGLLGWWARVWGGMLLAQIPSVMALSIGAQMAAYGAGMGAFVWSIAFLQLATDLYSLIPFGFTGSGGSPFGSLPSRVTGLMVGGLAGGAAAGAASKAVAWPAGATAGHMADIYGY